MARPRHSILGEVHRSTLEKPGRREEGPCDTSDEDECRLGSRLSRSPRRWRRSRHSRLQLQLEDYAQLPITGELDGQNTTRAARPSQLPARRARRPALLRQRSQRPALHPRQADEEVHRLPGFQRARRAARPLPEVHLRAQLRHRPHQLPVRSRLRAQRRLLHDAHGGPERCRARRRRSPAWSLASI